MNKNKETKSLILGTAAFKSGYGISNLSDSLTNSSSVAIIEYALDFSVQNFDTAPSYGNAETILGSVRKQGRNFVVSTKLSYEACIRPELLFNAVSESIERLKVSEIDILYLHNEQTLLEGETKLLLNELKKIQERGLFKRLGVSIYSGETLQILRKRYTEIDVFQVPENICDRRLRNANFSQEMMNDGREYIVRSVFLQGLLLMSEKKIPDFLNMAKPSISSLIFFAKKNNISVLDLCLAYAKSIPWCDSILVGATSILELSKIMNSKIKLPEKWESEILPIPHELIDPRSWN